MGRESWAAILLVALCIACSAGSKSREPTPPSPTTAPRVIDTGRGRWTIEPVATAPLEELQIPKPVDPFKSLPGREASQKKLELGKSPGTDVVLKPLIENPQDLFWYVSNEGSLDRLGLNAHLLQKVPGFPNDARFVDDRFDIVREAFSPACVASASKEMAQFSLLAANATNKSALLALLEAPRTDFDRECLTPLEDVPIQVRRVSGLLTARDEAGVLVPLCSATAIGNEEIVTSRHCFFDADSGKAKPALAQLESSGIEMHFFAQNGGSAIYTVIDRGVKREEESFKAFDDAVRLSIVGGTLTSWAEIAPQAAESVPITTWVVGPTDLIERISDGFRVLETVRGAAPNACAVIEKTPAGCLFHTCQTGRSTSGAGLLKVGPKGKVLLVGVHKGPIERGEGCLQDLPASLTINLATDASRL